MDHYSRADIIVMEDAEFWSSPKDKEHWIRYIDPKRATAREMGQFFIDAGFPGEI